jgi:hypothetical protein
VTLVEYRCDRCGVKDATVIRYGGTDASGNNCVDYFHEKCDPVVLARKQELKAIESELYELAKRIGRVR